MSTVEAPASHLPLPMQNILSRLAANSTEAEQALVRKAYAYAAAAHAGQVRLSGEPYLSHPLAVAEVLAELGFDAHSVAAGLLHDTVEDTKVTLEEVDAEFGEQVADIVDGVTKISMMTFDSKEEQQAENIRKMILAMSHDIRTPLTGIVGATNVLLEQDGGLTQEQRQQLFKAAQANFGKDKGNAVVKSIIEEMGLTSTTGMKMSTYNKVVERLVEICTAHKAELESEEGTKNDGAAEE